MSYADEIRDMFEIYAGLNELHIEQGIWTMRNGNTISVKDMTDNHIKNTIRMLQRGNSPFADGWIEKFKKELNSRGYEI